LVDQIHLYEVISRINKAKKMLSQEHGRTARDEEVAELVGMTVEKLRTVVKSARAPTSMERPIGKEKDTTIGVSLGGGFLYWLHIYQVFSLTY
jgi:RNA polymerase primary sigma factor